MRRERDRDAGTMMMLAINGECWRVEIMKVSRVASDWFLHVVAIGPRAHTLFVRSARPLDAGATWQQLLAKVRQWLGRNDTRPCAFLDLGDPSGVF